MLTQELMLLQSVCEKKILSPQPTPSPSAPTRQRLELALGQISVSSKCMQHHGSLLLKTRASSKCMQHHGSLLLKTRAS